MWFGSCLGTVSAGEGQEEGEGLVDELRNSIASTSGSVKSRVGFSWICKSRKQSEKAVEFSISRAFHDPALKEGKFQVAPACSCCAANSTFPLK